MKNLGTLLLFVFIKSISTQDEDLTCTTSFCTDYKGSYGCSALPENCQIQNSTHSGLILPFPGSCNCCDHCLVQIAEGESCAVGSPSSPTPTSICGDGLACNADTLTCQRINTTCTAAQDEYDSKRIAGTLGYMEYRPSCDRNGLFEPYYCIPGENCYCLSEDGERVFGDIDYSDNAAGTLHCKCSRSYHEGVKMFGTALHPGQYFRCLSNGDFDELQCIGDQCYCVDSYDGGPTTSSVMTAVNISRISEDTVSCFNEELHIEGNYYKPCESQYLEKMQEIEDLEQAGYEVIGYVLPNCQLDGNYGAVQKNSTSKFCVDPQGNNLEDFAVNADDDLADTMNCNCARARSIMSSSEKPSCCPNGNYASVQCRRGYCRCVDVNGNQIEQEVPVSNKESLSCYDSCTS